MQLADRKTEAEALRQAAIDHIWFQSGVAWEDVTAPDGVKVIAEGKGCYITDIEGKTLFDCASGLWLAEVGYGRQEIADECEAALNARLALAKWTVRRGSLSICPHSPVYEPHHKDGGRPGHRNFEWIAPETLPRLDFGARLEREAETYRRLVSYRDDRLKKQGAPRDPALHTP